MKQKAAAPTTRYLSASSTFTFGRLAVDFLDTLWRIALPLVLLAGVGIVADIGLSSAPWLTLAGMVAGVACSGFLIRKRVLALGDYGGPQ